MIEAARWEFEERGFDGTHSNAIARRAGYAPQTFYRHFDDKLAIFAAVYRKWAEDEEQFLASVDNFEQMADRLIEHHRGHRVFRRSLRTLSVSEPVVAAIRAQARRRQMETLTGRFPAFARLAEAEKLAAIFKVERICDAIADDEFAAFNIGDADSRLALIALIDTLA